MSINYPATTFIPSVLEKSGVVGLWVFAQECSYKSIVTVCSNIRQAESICGHFMPHDSLLNEA
jgi:hypothetical protein